MKAKRTVKHQGCSFEIGYAVGVASGVFAAHGKECIVTSLNDGKHSANSLHYSGKAVDLRTNHLTVPERDQIFAKLRSLLEPLGYDVLFEGDHFHLEHDPKAGESFVRYVS